MALLLQQTGPLPVAGQKLLRRRIEGCRVIRCHQMGQLVGKHRLHRLRREVHQPGGEGDDPGGRPAAAVAGAGVAQQQFGRGAVVPGLQYRDERF